MSDPCAVYRFYDEDDDLLYVGKSLDPFSRSNSHKQDPRFFAVSIIEVEWFEDQVLATLAETTAIIREKPKWNKHHAAKPRIKTRTSLTKTEMVEIISKRGAEVHE